MLTTYKKFHKLMKANISGESAEMYGLKISGAILKKLYELIQNFQGVMQEHLRVFHFLNWTFTCRIFT